MFITPERRNILELQAASFVPVPPRTIAPGIIWVAFAKKLVLLAVGASFAGQPSHSSVNSPLAKSVSRTEHEPAADSFASRSSHGRGGHCMEQLSIKKHDVAIVLLHWFNAIGLVHGVASGLALIVAPAYRVMPQWYLTMIASAFGSRANLLRVHVALGLTWIVVFTVYGVFGYRNYLRKEVLVNEIGLDQDDWRVAADSPIADSESNEGALAGAGIL